MLTNPVRTSLWDGWRCIRRYPIIWRTLAWLAFTNALFLLAVRLVALWRGEAQLVWLRPGWADPTAWLTGTPDSIWWLTSGAARVSIEAGILPAIETVAGLFNNVVTTFPVAVIAALGVLFNWRGSLGKLKNVLRKRFGHWSWLMLGLVLVCALATLAKSALYFHPPWISDAWWMQWGPATAAVAALFEYLFGAGVQAFLILHAYAWVRGLNFETESMREVALRRFGATAKWAGIVVLAQAVLIEAPLAFAFAKGWPDSPEVVSVWLKDVRLGFAITLLVMASMQAWLTLHGETLGRAWRAHWRLMFRHAWSVLWFIIIAAVHCFALQVLRSVVLQALGEDTAPGLAWTLLWPMIFGAIAGWLLASWVCLFKRSE